MIHVSSGATKDRKMLHLSPSKMILCLRVYECMHLAFVTENVVYWGLLLKSQRVPK